MGELQKERELCAERGVEKQRALEVQLEIERQREEVEREVLRAKRDVQEGIENKRWRQMQAKEDTELHLEAKRALWAAAGHRSDAVQSGTRELEDTDQRQEQLTRTRLLLALGRDGEDRCFNCDNQIVKLNAALRALRAVFSATFDHYLVSSPQALLQVQEALRRSSDVDARIPELLDAIMQSAKERPKP